MRSSSQQQARELGLLPSPVSSPAVDQANQELKALQFRAVTDYNRLRDAVARLGSASDTLRLRQQLSEYAQSFKRLAVEFKQKVARHPAREAAATQKLIRDFQTLLVASEKLMASAKQKEAASLPLAAAGTRPAAGPGAGTPPTGAAAGELATRAAAAAEAATAQKQQLLATESALAFNEAMIEERDAAVRTIGAQIGEVHSIFQDLAVLVADQGAALDDIEANIHRAAVHTEEANVQLVRAERSQRSANRSWCFLLTLGAIVFLALILILAA